MSLTRRAKQEVEPRGEAEDGGDSEVDEEEQRPPPGSRVVRLDGEMARALRALIAESGEGLTASDLMLNLSRFTLASPAEMQAMRREREEREQARLDSAVTNSYAGAVSAAPEWQPAADDAVRTLRWTTATEAADCSICYDEFAVGEKVREVPCGHRFHNECLLGWLERSGCCPFCRKEVGPASPAEPTVPKSAAREGGRSRESEAPGPSSGV